MGVWGTGINSNDTAADVMELCREVYPIVTPEEADCLVLKEYSEILTYAADDDELADFWYAYVNWQWDHGVLLEKNKFIVLSMLHNQCGMHRWIEAGNQKDIRNRRVALDKLNAKLMSPQPPVKIPRPKIDKAKHRPGTVIVFKTKETHEDIDELPWTIRRLSPPKWFENTCLRLPTFLTTPYDAQGKYLALLCVGTEREPYSKYFPDLYHEHSVYSFYDYCGKKPPLINSLSKCGFLPNISISFSDFNNGIVDHLDWTYVFTTIDRFCPNHPLIAQFEQLTSLDELERFHRLISKKDYSNQSIGCFTLQDAFEAFYDEKLRFLEVGMTIDNLLDPCKENPKLISPAQYNKRNN